MRKAFGLAGGRLAFSVALLIALGSAVLAAPEQAVAAGKEGVAKAAPRKFFDPATGKLVEAKDVASQEAVKLPPGDVKGKVEQADGAPQKEVAITLTAADSGEELMETTTDDKGEFVLKDVKAGRYVLLAGDPGVGVVLEIVAEAEPGALVMVVPAGMDGPGLFSAAWFAAHPLLGGAAVGGAAVVVGGAAYGVNDLTEDSDRVISPISP